MLKKTMTYQNIDGDTVVEDFYFNLTKAELLKMKFSENEGFEARIRRIANDQASAEEIIETMDMILRRAYGLRTENGKFIKPPQAFDEFMATEAYSDLLFEIATDAKKSSEFVNAIIPSNLRDEVEKVVGQQNVFDQNERPQDVPVNSARAEAGLSANPENMSEDELLNSLGVSNTFRTTNGLTDDEIMAMSGMQLAKQPREVLVRAYQLKNK